MNVNDYVLNLFDKITLNIECSHARSHILPFIEFVLSIPQENDGCIVEAGCFKGGATAKYSIIAALTRRPLIVFDSFKGIPENEGGFKKGEYYGSIDEVRSNVRKYGRIECCRFIEGWFKNTMPNFSEKIAAIYLDVDISSSTKTCLKFLYPLLISGGILYSHDGEYPLVRNVYDNDKFWKEEVGCPKPIIEGFGEKIMRIIK